MSSPRRIAFLHPDLGIGGAERAIVDAAIALQSKGAFVTVFTNHHDRSHCFEETITDLNVVVIGDFIPRSICGICYALFAYVRFFFAALWFSIAYRQNFDLVYVDQISAPILLLKAFGFKVLFYAHFPDFLLSKRGGLLKKLYRIPIDFTEKLSLAYSDVVVFNSNFTSNVYKEHFPCLNKTDSTILYPVPNFSKLKVTNDESIPILDNIPYDATVFLSINRYEKKKNIDLAIKAFDILRKDLRKSGELQETYLIHVGGYDNLVEENKLVYNDLDEMGKSLNIADCVFLMKSCSNNIKVKLLKRATVLLYTPSYEHFGIVPVEAMYLGCPVIAVNNGGPLETVLDNVTGFLCDAKPSQFAEKMKLFTLDENLKKRMGDAGHARTVEKFSFTTFQNDLWRTVTDLIN